jgi:hypothetical protein
MQCPSLASKMTTIPTEALAATWYTHGDDAKIEHKPVKQPKDLAPGEVSICAGSFGEAHH